MLLMLQYDTIEMFKCNSIQFASSLSRQLLRCPVSIEFSMYTTLQKVRINHVMGL